MLVSIITINYNQLEGLKRTVASVLSQTYTSIEYIIIDGASSDGSEAFIKQNASQLSYFVSEKDEGIYHAMNKGIDQANGEYLLFLNAGDYLYNDNVIEDFVANKPKAHMVYGDVCLKDASTEKLMRMPEIDGVVSALNNSLNHQVIFFNKALFLNDKRYDCSYKIAADWVFINNAILFDKCTVQHIDLVVSYFDTNGVSSNKNLRLNDRERYLNETFDDNFLTLLRSHQELNQKYSYLKRQFLVKLHFKLLAIKKMFTN